MEHLLGKRDIKKRENRGELRQFLIDAVNCGLLH